MISALFVETDGVYFNLPGVDPWDIDRDARRFNGTSPVVAHPPCQRWSPLANVNEARWGVPAKSDGGLFEFALRTLQRCGGVLEHPARSMAWEHFDIARPKATDGWLYVDSRGRRQVWTCNVEQGHYGHPMRKATWLLYVGYKKPFDLIWGSSARPVNWENAPYTRAQSGAFFRSRNRPGAATEGRREFLKWYQEQTGKKNIEFMGKKARLVTPIAFRDVLIRLAEFSQEKQ